MGMFQALTDSTVDTAATPDTVTPDAEPDTTPDTVTVPETPDTTPDTVTTPGTMPVTDTELSQSVDIKQLRHQHNTYVIVADERSDKLREHPQIGKEHCHHGV